MSRLCLIRVSWLTLPLPSLKSTFSQPFKQKCLSEVLRIGSIILFHLSKLWKDKFFILCDVIFLVRLQGKFEVDRSLQTGPYCNVFFGLADREQQELYEAAKIIQNAYRNYKVARNLRLHSLAAWWWKAPSLSLCNHDNFLVARCDVISMNKRFKRPFWSSISTGATSRSVQIPRLYPSNPNPPSLLMIGWYVSLHVSDDLCGELLD